MADHPPVRLRTTEGLVCDAAERRTADRQHGPVNLVTHVNLSSIVRPITPGKAVPASCPFSPICRSPARWAAPSEPHAYGRSRTPAHRGDVLTRPG